MHSQHSVVSEKSNQIDRNGSIWSNPHYSVIFVLEDPKEGSELRIVLKVDPHELLS